MFPTTNKSSPFSFLKSGLLKVGLHSDWIWETSLDFNYVKPLFRFGTTLTSTFIFITRGFDDLILNFYETKQCDHVCKSVGIWDVIVNPIYGCGVKMTPDIIPIYVGLERSCSRDSKNVSYVDVGLV